jgi:hypothetical protein
MDISTLAAVTTPAGMVAWLQQYLATPLRPAASASDLSAIFQKVIAVLTNGPLTKAASDIIGTDGDYKISLNAANIPALPRTLMVYVSLDGSSNYSLVQPVAWNSTTKTIGGMNSPIDFPNQIIKIIIS